eukprot:5812164-Prymnesium_polylepis.2
MTGVRTGHAHAAACTCTAAHPHPHPHPHPIPFSTCACHLPNNGRAHVRRDTVYGSPHSVHRIRKDVV